MAEPELTLKQLQAFPFGRLESFTYLDDYHWYRLVNCKEPNTPNQCHGLIQPHLIFREDEWKWCAGFVPFTGHASNSSNATWDILSSDPLSLDPSLLCRAQGVSYARNADMLTPELWEGMCGDHGYITDGKWVPA